MPWQPSVPDEVPTLGYVVLDWITEMLAAPDHAEYVPFVPYREQEDFILAWYQLNPETGRRTVQPRRARAASRLGQVAVAGGGGVR